ncbi:MAG TPA: transaldolase [Candidatus Kapabacteria bacterium]|nr:transaldolase [Candidatus Kapabacteria bacterium]
MSNPWKSVAVFGQSLWYDNISRSLLTGGRLAAMIDEYNVNGVTSNPAIFEKAISGGKEYDDDIRMLIEDGATTNEIYDKLTTDDVRLAADILYDTFVATNTEDGYVSIEVDPTIANNAAETIVQAKRLWEIVDRPNIMIKIPGTPSGLPAITQTISEGINVNVTLLFGIENYADVARAYIAGINARLERGEDVSRIRSVASFFLSRVDTNVDALLAKKGDAYKHLLGKAANANAKLAYERYCKIFYGKEFDTLRAAGANVQRCLWASVSTKNPAYSDTLYIEPLIGKETVTTVPDDTLAAFADHGNAADTLTHELDGAHTAIDELRSIGIDTENVARDLQIDGVKKFEDAFRKLLSVLETKRAAVAETVA